MGWKGDVWGGRPLRVLETRKGVIYLAAIYGYCYGYI